MPWPFFTTPVARRRFLGGGFLAYLLRFRQKENGSPSPPSLSASGPPLHAHMQLGNPPLQPLDTMILFERGDNNNGRAETHEVLSLIHQEKGARSYPWTLYASLETHHTEGDACVVCSRLHKYGPGWSTGLHSEVFTHSRAVVIGCNIEVSNDYQGTEATLAIGLNIQAKGPQKAQYGIQIHDGGGGFERGIGLNGAGAIGLDLGGKFDVGVHAHQNPIRLSEGTCIELEDMGTIHLRYLKGRIEFLKGDRCFAHIDVDGPDHAL